MSSFGKVALFALPFALIFLGIRWLGGDEGERWRERVEAQCPGAVVAVDEKDLIVIAPDRERGVEAAAEVRDFRRALVARHKDLLGEPRFERMVIVIFPDAAAVQAYAGQATRLDPYVTGNLHGYADPRHGAIFVPADAVGTLRHETVHWIMETSKSPNGPPYSTWLSEGLAQLFEVFEPNVPAPLPGPEPESVAAIDVQRLIHLEHRAFMDREVRRNYLEAHALCAFLFETRPNELREYVDTERRTADTRPYIFRRIFRDDEEPFRRDLAAFLARPQ